jgi:tRNA(Leu) C34 or U34 (ribose-2'-O)-methylase TrmL
MGVALQEVSAAVFHKIGYGDNPDGVLGVAAQPRAELTALPSRGLRLYVVTEGLEKPGNLGAILRSAEAATVTGLIVCESQTDIWNPNVIRASQGAFCTVPIAIASAPEVLEWLCQRHLQILVATPAARRCYTEIDLRLPSALILGAEHMGVSPIWRSELPIRIPMACQVDSLSRRPQPFCCLKSCASRESDGHVRSHKGTVGFNRGRWSHIFAYWQEVFDHWSISRRYRHVITGGGASFWHLTNPMRRKGTLLWPMHDFWQGKHLLTG